jgi:CheY-like chemotaxis protein
MPRFSRDFSLDARVRSVSQWDDHEEVRKSWGFERSAFPGLQTESRVRVSWHRMTTTPRASILVVDDDLVQRKRIREILEREGYVVVEAADGKSALHYLVSQDADEPSLILLELETRVMTGWEFLAILRSYHRLRQIPVVALTTQPSSAEALAHGEICRYLQKPPATEELLATIKDCARSWPHAPEADST